MARSCVVGAVSEQAPPAGITAPGAGRGAARDEVEVAGTVGESGPAMATGVLGDTSPAGSPPVTGAAQPTKKTRMKPDAMRKKFICEGSHAR